MVSLRGPIALVALLYASHVSAAANSTGASLKLLTSTGVKNETAPSLYAWMFEDINHSGDGGLYGELLANRAFEGSDINWGTISNYPGNSITYQENSCEAYGMHPKN